jgi:hypothetical protein
LSLQIKLGKRTGVVVDDVDKVGARGRAGSTGELVVVGGVLCACSTASKGSRTRRTHPESDLVDTHALCDHGLGEVAAVEGRAADGDVSRLVDGLDAADVAQDLIEG